MTIKVGIIANEFFDPNLGRMGGFGWLAKAAAEAFAISGEVEPVFITSEFELPLMNTSIHGTQVIDRTGGIFYRVNRLRSEKFDRLISIDWRPNYNGIAAALLDVPLTVWVQDPRSTYDIRRIKTLAIPNSPEPPAGIDFIDCSSLRKIQKLKRFFRKEIVFAGHANYLEEKISDTYHVHNIDYHFLCDPLNHVLKERILTEKREVVFLGRLDPIKRPWLFLELARKLPHVIFHFLGKNHFEVNGGWNNSNVPENIRFHGHVEGLVKQSILQNAWVVINTSIHEALPISFLESFSMGIPVLAMQNPDELASRFGVFSGRWNGDGLEGLASLERGLNELLKDKSSNLEIGAKCAEWVRNTHSQDLFVRQFLSMHRNSK